MTKPSLHVESDQQKQAEHKGEVTLIFNHYKYNSCLYWKQQYYCIYIELFSAALVFCECKRD